MADGLAKSTQNAASLFSSAENRGELLIELFLVSCVFGTWARNRQVDVKRQYSIGAAPQEKLCVVDRARAEQVG